MKESYALDQLLRTALQGLLPLGIERLPLSQAGGRTLAWDLTALRDSPSLPLAAVDGYALRTADLSGARRARPAKLMVSDLIGEGLAVPVRAGEPLPSGCDAVVPLGDTDRGAPALCVYRELWPYDNYIRQGSDYRSGEKLLSAGDLLDAAALCLLACAGHESADVRALPRAALIAPPTAPDACVLYLRRLLEEWGVVLSSPAQAHFILTLGPAGAEAQPLCPQWAGSAYGLRALARLEGKPVFSLPEEPQALFKAAILLLRPVLAYLTGSRRLLPQPVQAVLDTPFPRATPQRTFLPARYGRGRVALPSGSFLREVPRLNCLIDLAPGTPPLSAGTRVKVLTL